MTVFGIVGTIGAGKTLLMTQLGLMKYSCGYDIYSNYLLKHIPYKELGNIKDLNELADGRFKALLMDELWISADSRKSMSVMSQFMSTKVLQSRKVKSDVYYTTQHLGQVDKRIRDITELIYHPRVIRDQYNKPIASKVDVFKVDIYGRLVPTRNFTVPLLWENYYTCDLYDTSEIVEEMEGDTIEVKEIIEKYEGFQGKKAKLKAILTIEEGIPSTMATQLTNYILD